MATNFSMKKRSKSKIPKMNIRPSSTDISPNVSYLIGYIDTNTLFLTILFFDRLTNLSFSELYEKSGLIGWTKVFIDLREALKSDEKSREKRLTLNRLIDEYSTNSHDFDRQVIELNKHMNRQLSSSIVPEHECFIRFQTLNGVYDEVQRWRRLQIERRMFHREYNQRSSLVTLQHLATNLFIELAQLPYTAVTALTQLFEHCLIIVAQPSGIDCVAVTKYERNGETYSTKIKTRIICLLDPVRVGKYVKLSQVGMILFLKDRQTDPTGDVQSPLLWKERIIKCENNEKRTFWCVECTENDTIQLRKMSSNGKLWYNNVLCQLEFHVLFTLIEMDFLVPVVMNSQLFGICSHGKYSAKYLTKVFLEEVQNSHGIIPLATYINVLDGYICSFHRRITGVEAKAHTRQFILDELTRVYQAFLIAPSSPTGPMMPSKLDIYEDLLRELFTQMKFMASHPFLTMMYQDNLFLGICNSNIDDKLTHQINGKSQLCMRFARLMEQETLDNPNIIVALHNGILCRSRVTHNYLTQDISTCICAAAKNGEDQIEVYHDEKISPFSSFRRYYDPDLSRDNIVHTEDKTRYYPLNALLRNTEGNHLVDPPAAINQQNVSCTFDMRAQLTGHEDLTGDAMAFLQEQLARWCRIRNIQGSLTRHSTNNIDLSDDDFNDFFHVDNMI